MFYYYIVKLYRWEKAVLNELLVLGQIPGTNLQVTFNDYLALVCLVILGMVWHRNPRLIRYGIAKLNFWLVIFSLRYRQPAGLIGRTS